MSILQFFKRYWFIIPLLLFIIALQLGFGFVAATTFLKPSDEPEQSKTIAVAQQAPTVTATTAPTATPLPAPTVTSTSTRTPLPTFTASPTAAPSSTPAPPPSPTNTRVPTWTPTVTPSVTLTPPLPTPDKTHGFTATVPILMYHYLSQPPLDADTIRRDLSVSPEQFEAHLAYLRQEGYETITFKQLGFALGRGDTLPPKPIIITFDDGYRDNYENAFPVLRKYGYTGTFFIFTQVIDTNNVSYLSWDMVTEMHRAGMEFGSHSYRHIDLSGRDADFLVYEILGSKEAIEERIQEPVRAFSYPAGRYDALTMQIVESANFWTAVTTQWGAGQSYDGRFEMPRIRIRGSDTAADLAEKLTIAGE